MPLKPIVSDRKSHKRRKNGRKLVNRIVERRLIRRVSFDEYRKKVQDVYDGPQGAMLYAASRMSLHVALGERLLKTRRFDLRGAEEILDIGCGAGQIAQHVLKYADPSARLTTCDLSSEMVRRARRRLGSRPEYIAADITRLPFADESFDCVTCGYVLEHLPDAGSGLAEIARVMRPRARMLLLVTEDNLGGALTSRFWYCRTHNRQELAQISHELGLRWRQELWFTPMHRWLRAGGICVEIEKVAS